jgi:glycosyltransferase involved in cell wall biosynthesis
MRQRQPLAHANWVANIPHGLPTDSALQLGEPEGEPYLAFLGRLSATKRPDRAIEIARRTGIKLKIAAKIDPDEKVGYLEKIKSNFDGEQIEFVGEINETEKPDFLRKGAALLFPIDWPEPFGLVVIEAMACGVPVIAWPNGAMPEIIDEGVTGFLVSSVDEAVARVGEALTLDRKAIRQVFERRFSLSRMVDDYEETYRTMLSSMAPTAYSGTRTRRQDGGQHATRTGTAA